ncbi:FAD-binding oxidoreductase [Afifella sp. IM 167]|uniref:NAD(P)/FAD-dependent oxidoreductase n=1 Tax=Afifella sp. IM 167 TaxID=2033586 RepID=UPI001CCD52AB|nr:FAD-binding oxidoreductase [Afifella sp. IM 167]MBZ8132152.1 FAD-dependent oxidoreductase [Afifella sp. IM 167]
MAGERFDIAVIGAGIAGASVASELAGGEGGKAGRIVLLERESQPGYHTTGRSAALFSTTYGPPVIRALSRASARFFDAPPEGFAAHALLGPRGVMMIARADQSAQLAALMDELGEGRAWLLDAIETRRLAPLLREGYAAGAVFEPEARDIDVNALHHGYLRRLRGAGGVVKNDCALYGLSREGEAWRLETGEGAIHADVVVNAAGAWADEVAAMAGIPAIGLVPKRRTALTVKAPEGMEPSAWPMVVDIEEEFYLKPEAGRLLLSPADETPSPPCDAQPEELDIAICIDRIERAFALQIRHIESRWAGLRSFVADKCPVAGFETGAPGFFWLAGQGGYGIQSAPALAKVAAALLAGREIPAEIADEGVLPAALSPARLEGRG